jgi:hypothetical protein
MKCHKIYIYIYMKAKAVPLHATKALGAGGRRHSTYSFSTSGLYGGEWSASRSGRALAPGTKPPVPTVQEAGCATEPVWTERLEEESFTSAGDRTSIAVIQFVGSLSISLSLSLYIYIYIFIYIYLFIYLFIYLLRVEC